MGLLPRLKARLGALFAPAEDPRQAPLSPYERQAALLQRLQVALVQVAASKQQLTAQTARLRADLPLLEEQARQALVAGREDLARLTLQRRHAAALELQRLEEQVDEVAQEEQRLTLAEQGLAARVEAFRVRQEVASARYTAAEAQVQLNEALAGASRELAELGGAVERTEAKAQHLRARADTLDDLVQAGLLPEAGPSPDLLEQQLARLDVGRAVEAELAILKQQLGRTDQSERRP